MARRLEGRRAEADEDNANLKGRVELGAQPSHLGHKPRKSKAIRTATMVLLSLRCSPGPICAPCSAAQVYEMLVGRPPFYSENVNEMYEKILQDELTFPSGVSVNEDAKSLIRQLLVRDPLKRLGAGEADAKPIKSHPFFEAINWDLLMKKQIAPPFKPEIVRLPLGAPTRPAACRTSRRFGAVCVVAARPVHLLTSRTPSYLVCRALFTTRLCRNPTRMLATLTPCFPKRRRCLQSLTRT
jgi:serine/threonine protein kinase